LKKGARESDRKLEVGRERRMEAGALDGIRKHRTMSDCPNVHVSKRQRAKNTPKTREQSVLVSLRLTKLFPKLSLIVFP